MVKGSELIVELIWRHHVMPKCPCYKTCFSVTTRSAQVALMRLVAHDAVAKERFDVTLRQRAACTWAPCTRGAPGQHGSRNQHDLAIGTRFDDRVVRLGSFGQRELLANDWPQGASGKAGTEGGMQAGEFALGGIP